MARVWKLAPGDNANNWDVFRVNRCIGIGWLLESDYRDFPDAAEALAALEEVYGPNAKGHGTRQSRTNDSSFASCDAQLGICMEMVSSIG